MSSDHAIQSLSSPPTDAHQGRALFAASALVRSVVVGGILLLAILWGFVAADLRHEREIHIDQARHNTKNLAIAFEKHVESTLTAIDALLISLRHELRENRALKRADVMVAWAHQGPLKDSIVQVGVIDRTGHLIYNSLNPSAVPLFIGNSEHFKAHLQQGEDKLFVDQAIRLPVNGVEAIPFSRRVSADDGTFLGVVSVLVRPSHFSNFYQSIQLSSQGAVTLVRNGVVVARASANVPATNPIGLDISKVLPEPDTVSESRVVVSPVDGLTRLIHYRRVQGQPLAVIVSTTDVDYLEEYRATQLTHGVYALLTSLGLILMAGSLILLARRLEVTGQVAAANERRYRSLFENAPMAYQSLDREGRIIDVNAAWSQLFGFEADEVRGKSISEFLNEKVLPSLRCPTTQPPGTNASEPGQFHDCASPPVFEITRKNGERRQIVAAGCDRGLVANGDDTASLHVLRDVTHKLAQASALLATEARLRGIVENINVVTWEYDLDNERFAYVSPQVEAMFGYPAAAWMEKNFWYQHLHPQDRDAAIEFCDSHTEQRLDHDFEYRFLKQDGSAIWIRDIVKVLKDPYGTSVRLAGVLLDVTAEKAVATELANEHALLRSLIDSVPDLIFFKDLNNVYLGCNRAFAEFTGRTELEQIGKTDSQSFEPETAASFLEKDQEMLALGEGCHHEEWVMYPDGRLVLLDILRAPLMSAQGEPLGLIGISRDITERKSAEESLLLAQSVFESTTEAIMVTDTEARILMVNPAFVAVTGWSASDAVGRRPNLLRSGRHSKDFYAQMWAALKGQGHWEGEICNRHKSGELYVEWMTINAIRDPGGEVSRYVSLFSDITARKIHETEIWRQANFDALTGLANRNLFHDRLDRAMVSGRRKHQQVGLMFIDLDRFKAINDKLGHEVGDKMLIEAASRLQGCVRDEDTVARMGGDEFTVVLQGLDDQDALEAVAVKILAALARPFMLEAGPQYISGSVGVTIFPADAENTVDLLRNADIAMYQAKAAGRNCYQFYSAGMQEEALVRVELERDLRRAINGGELVLHYQPIVDTGSRDLRGAEAFLRWKHPVRGLLRPSEFLSVAQDSHLIVSLGEWVIDEVCRQWRTWVDAGHAPIRISINVSNVHFRDVGIGQCIACALERHAVPGSMLSLELNESVMVDLGESPSRVVQELAVLDLHYSLDDFGTGYASLTALKWLPFDTVKIDRGFMPGLLTSVDDQHMVNAIVLMAHSHNLAVVAEGVETELQLDFLRNIGCDFVQGYLIGSPVSGAEFGHVPKRHGADKSKPTWLSATSPEC